MSSILKGANYRPGNKSGNKQKTNGKSAQPVNQDVRQGLRGPGFQQQVHSPRVDAQSNAIGAVGGATINKTVLIRNP